MAAKGKMRVLDLTQAFKDYSSGKVLLIGNGPSILDRPLGTEIDAFDGPIVRFNEFILEPEECTGTKTDLWVICWKSHDVTHMHPELVHLITRVPKRIQYFEKEKRFRSTGVATMFWCLEAGYSAYLHGFDHFDRSKPWHYFTHDKGKPGHEHDAEIVGEAMENGYKIQYWQNHLP